MRRASQVSAVQIQQLIAWSVQGRQNAYKRSVRKDAQAAQESAACMEGSVMAWHKQFGNPTKMPVVRSIASPLNSRRKLLELACGHEVWSAIRQKTATCCTCQRACDTVEQGPHPSPPHPPLPRTSKPSKRSP